MTIINYINRFFGRKILKRSLIQKRSSQNLRNLINDPMQLEIMFYNRHHDICSDGCIYLDFDGSLGCILEKFNFEILFDSLKKEFYIPMTFIKKNYFCRRFFHIVGQVEKGLVFVRSVICCSVMKNLRKLFAHLIVSKFYYLVKEYYTIYTMVGLHFIHNFIFKITSLTNNKIYLSFIKLIEYFLLKISSVKNKVNIRFIRDYEQSLLVMDFGLSNMYESWDINLEFVKRIYIYFRMFELSPTEDIQAKVYCCRIGGIYLFINLKVFVYSLLFCNINRVISKILKNSWLTSFVDSCEMLLSKPRAINLGYSNNVYKSERLPWLLNCPNIITSNWFQQMKCITSRSHCI